MEDIRMVRRAVIEQAETEYFGKKRFYQKERIKEIFCSRCSKKGDIKRCRLENDDIDNYKCKRFEFKKVKTKNVKKL